ncbi:MAG: hypothetical protein JJ916_08610 [Phycisphaerales bacterium]|nr:hypothetical protein [Phycisphaerales bacterium]MBO6805288.1 hypothetical protein [Thalassospira sp.]
MMINLLLETVLRVSLSVSCLITPVDSSAAASQFIVEVAAPSDGKPINTICPVTSDEEVDPRFSVLVDGRVIGLCCRKCVTRFKADPQRYLASLPVSLANAAPVASDEPNATREAEHSHEHPDDVADGHQDNHVHDHADEAGAQNHAADSHSGESGTGHDHDRDHASESRSRIMVWLGKFHPPSTHLPIGILIGAALAEIGFILRRERWLRQASGFCLFIAMLGALGAMTLGWFNAGFVLLDDDWVQATHRWLGTSTAVLFIITFILFVRTRGCLIKRRELAYRAMLLICVSVVGATGFLGGALIYGLDHYSF